MTHPYTRLFVLPAPPDADNDVTEGYELGDVVHVTGGGVYDCRDATEGAAVWDERTGGGGSPDWGDIGGTLSDQTDLQTALDAKLTANTPITGATKTKITYDVDGLVTAGADATTADIPDSTNKRYVTDADLVDIGNLSGTNTGDQSLAGLQPLDSDLTAIAGLTPSNDHVIQRKGGAWVNRTIAQLLTDLTEGIQDLVALMVGGSGHFSIGYDDSAGSLVIDLNESSVGAMITDEYAIPHSGWVGPNGLGTWTYVSADAPSFVIDVPNSIAAIIGVGWRFKLTQTTTKYFIVTAKGSAGVSTTPITVYGGTDYTLTNTTISNPSFSPVKAPLGFPMDPAKWTVTFSDTSDRTQSSPTTNTWYNLGSLSISIPIGAWRISYKVSARVSRTASTSTNMLSTLSTANNSESDSANTLITTIGGASGTLLITTVLNMFNLLTLAAKTTYYLNARTTLGATDIGHRGDVGATVIKAECVYL